MTEIDLEGSDPSTGLFALVITVVDILTEALEREAVRRMERDQLTDEEIERVGLQLQAIETEIERLIDDEGIEDEVDRLRRDLDDVLSDAIERSYVDEAAVSTARGVTDGERDRSG